MIPEPPSLPSLSANDLLPLFQQKLEAAAATMVIAQGKKEIAYEIGRYLAQSNISEAPSYDISAARVLDLSSSALTPQETIRVTKAHAAIAETGTLVFVSGKENPTLSHFLPDIEIVILRRADLRAHLEQILNEMPKPLPRGLYCVTGPSRSADIEQTLLMGAHGPRFLHVIVWEDEKAA